MRRPSPLPEPPKREAPMRQPRPAPVERADVSARRPEPSVHVADQDAVGTVPLEVPWWRRIRVPGGPTVTDQDSIDSDAEQRSEPHPSVAPDNLRPLRADDAEESAHESDEHAGGIRGVWRASWAKRRALRSEMRRFTARARRRRVTWLSSIGAVVLLIAGSFAIAYSPLFAVRQITVVGASGLDPAVITDALENQVGRPLAQVDENAIREALEAFPLIETFNVQARPPHDLVVQISERTPVGVVDTGSGFDLVDGAGVVLSQSAEAPAGYPLVDVPAGADTPAFRALGTVLRSLPESVRVLVTAASAETPNSVVLQLGGTSTEVLWGSADKSAEKALVLDAAMRVHPPESTTRYDVSSPDAIIVR